MSLTCTKTFHWGPSQTKAFQQIKVAITADTLLTYINLTQPFDVETDTLDYQLGVVIKQDGVPIAFYKKTESHPTQLHHD